MLNKINAWVKENPYKFFTDRCGVEYRIAEAKNTDTCVLVSKSGVTIEKKISSLTFAGETLKPHNVYRLLNTNTTIDGQVFYGNIVDAINKWAKKEKKWFENGDSGKFKVTGAISKNNITLITLEDEGGRQQAIPLSRFVFKNKNMVIGNAIEMLTAATRFENTIRFGNDLERVNSWLEKEKPTFLDKGGKPFKIERVFRDNTSQIKFRITNEHGQTVERNAYTFTYGNGVTIRDGNVFAFLQNAKQFNNSIVFDAWQQGGREIKESQHFLPPFETLQNGNGIRLPNGQCAMVIAQGIKQTTKQKTIDIVIEDGTIIKNISENRYRGGLININTNRPVFNNMSLSNTLTYTDQTVARAMKEMIEQNGSNGNRSGIEFEYLYYLQNLGFKLSDVSFFENKFGIQERRLPDSFLQKDGKLVIFEFDGGGGHGGVFRELSQDVQRDTEKNKLYQTLIENAQQGKYEPNITDVMVVRVRGNSVPRLNPRNICEISYEHCSNEKAMIPEVIKNIVIEIDDKLNLGLSLDFIKAYPYGIDLEYDKEKREDFVDSMLGRGKRDQRIGEVSQTLGFGIPQRRMGQYMIITKVEPKESGKQSMQDKVHITFEDGRKTKTSYENFVNGTVNDSKFNKVIDCSGRKFEYTTSGAVKKQEHFAHAVRYYDEKPMEESIENQARMTVADIARIRQQFPIVNGVIVDQRGQKSATSLRSFVNRTNATDKTQSIADDVLNGSGTHATIHTNIDIYTRNDR